MRSAPIRALPRAWWEFLAYGFGTVIAFAIDVGVLVVLAGSLRLHYMLAAACSFTLGGIVLYLISIRWVFAIRRIGQPRLELPAFLALGLIGLLGQMVVMFIAVRYFDWFFLHAKVAAAAFTFVVNFLLRRWALFTRAAPGSDTRVATDA